MQRFDMRNRIKVTNLISLKQKAPTLSHRGFLLYLVPRAGLEPAQLAPPTPEAGVSTNFTTWAVRLAPFYSLALAEAANYKYQLWACQRAN